MIVDAFHRQSFGRTDIEEAVGVSAKLIGASLSFSIHPFEMPPPRINSFLLNQGTDQRMGTLVVDQSSSIDQV